MVCYPGLAIYDRDTDMIGHVNLKEIRREAYQARSVDNLVERFNARLVEQLGIRKHTHKKVVPMSFQRERNDRLAVDFRKSHAVLFCKRMSLLSTLYPSIKKGIAQ